MKKDIAVTIEGIGKKYVIGDSERYLALRDNIVKAIKLPINLLKGKKFKQKKEFWALKNISMEVQRGDVVGIIGRNGAGKSTLLKILSRITEPTEGTIKYHGKVSSLLEVGTGFHPELTGRENVYLNGAILGMSKKEIDKKFNEIVEFSGVKEFIDMPVKRYSSGMQVRLAFSVAANLDSDILVIDEVLAVGDAEFQKKCLGKMDEVTKDSDRTIFFVSHDMGAIRRICNKVVVLERGEIVFFGEVDKGVERYLHDERLSNAAITFDYDMYKDKCHKLQMLSASIVKNNKVNNSFIYGEKIDINIDFEIKKEFTGGLISIEIFNTEGICVFCSTSSDYHGHLNHTYKVGDYRYSLSIPNGMYLKPGNYIVTFQSTIPKQEFLHMPVESVSFQVNDGKKSPSYLLSHGRKGIIEPNLKWDINLLSK